MPSFLGGVEAALGYGLLHGLGRGGPAGHLDAALDRMEPMIRAFPRYFYMNAAWLRIDPNFAALKSNARFERVLRETEAEDRTRAPVSG
jgi:hypothetical protein